MATVNSKGFVILQDSDDITPLHTVINTVTSSISDYLTANKTIKFVTNTTQRATWATSYAPTATNPVFVWRQDATAGLNLEYSIDGVTWNSVRTTESDPMAWTTYAAAIPNATGANNVVSGRYTLIGGTVHFDLDFTFGSGGALSGSLNLTLPTNFSGLSTNSPLNGVVELWDNSTSTRQYGTMRRIGANSAQVMIPAGTAASGTSPWTWAQSDTIRASGTYRWSA